MLWIVLAIGGYALGAISNVADRFLVEKQIKNPVTVSIVASVITCAIGIVFFVVRGFPTLPVDDAFLMLAAGAFWQVAVVPYYKALAQDDASRIVPLFQIIPVFVLIFSSLFIGEQLVPKQLLGFLVILTGSFLLSMKQLGLRIWELRSSFWLMMLSSFLYAVPFVILKFVVTSEEFWDVLTYEFLGAGAGALILFLLPGYLKIAHGELTRIPRIGWGVLAISEGVYTFAKILVFYAVSLASVSLVAVLGGTQPFFVLLYGLILSFWFPHIIKEDVGKRTVMLKVFAIVLIAIGAWSMN